MPDHLDDLRAPAGLLHSRQMDDDLAELLIAYRSLCEKAGVEPLPEAEIEKCLAAILVGADRKMTHVMR